MKTPITNELLVRVFVIAINKNLTDIFSNGHRNGELAVLKNGLLVSDPYGLIMSIDT